MGHKQEEFLEYIAGHYDELKARFKSFCHDKKYEWDEDIFSDTILKCAEKEKKIPLTDSTPTGIENYFFKAFKTNLHREKQYARNKKRDFNISDEMLKNLYENFSNAKKTGIYDKLLSDLRKDYYALYILNAVKENFDDEHFYLFRLKYFSKLTYEELAKKTNIKSSRQKVINVKHWLQENLNIEEMKRHFEEDYEIFL